MSHNVIILYFNLPYFHVSNSALFLQSIFVLSFCIDVALAIAIKNTWALFEKLVLRPGSIIGYKPRANNARVVLNVLAISHSTQPINVSLDRQESSNKVVTRTQEGFIVLVILTFVTKTSHGFHGLSIWCPRWGDETLYILHDFSFMRGIHR